MPDPYWEELGKQYKEMNARGQHIGGSSRYDAAQVECKKCKKKFLSRGRVLCDDCKPEREYPEEREPKLWRRLGEGFSGLDRGSE